MNSKPFLQSIVLGCLSANAVVAGEWEYHSGRFQAKLSSNERSSAKGSNSCIQLPLPFGSDITKAKITKQGF